MALSRAEPRSHPLTLGFHDAFLVGVGFSILAVILSAAARGAG